MQRFWEFNFALIIYIHDTFFFFSNISFEKNKKELAAHDTPNFNIFSSKDIHNILCVYNKTIRWRLSCCWRKS